MASKDLGEVDNSYYDQYCPPPKRGNPNLQPGPGRPKGSLNRVTVLARDLARGIIESPAYLAALAKAAEERTLDPSIEKMLWAYGYGKPVERLEISAPQIPEEERARIAERASRLAREAIELGEPLRLVADNKVVEAQIIDPAANDRFSIDDLPVPKKDEEHGDDDR